MLMVENLQTNFRLARGLLKAVDGFSYHVDQGEIIALVGESGCGKSMSQLSVMQLISSPGEIVGGKVIFEGEDILKFDPDGPEMRKIRGGKISMIFQEPMTSLNPVLTIGRQLTEMLELHLKMSRRAAKERSIELLRMVGLPDAERRIDDYPHQFSGGMRQRVMIAMAISCNPKILIADEPTTAIDVTTQVQLLELLKDMAKRLKMSLVIVTHDLGVVARYAQRIYVMYAGRIVEQGTVKEIFSDPQHPYTRSLLRCISRIDDPEERELEPIMGAPPSLIDLPPTCAFLPRCSSSIEKCQHNPWPGLKFIKGQQHAACYALNEISRN